MNTEKGNSGIKVSLFKKFKYIKDCSLPAIITGIKERKLEKEINTIRKYIHLKNDEWAVLKKSLPAFTPSATFNQVRQKEYLLEYTSTIVLDIDDVDINIESSNIYIDKANEDPHTYASFISPRGNGFKLLIKVNTGVEDHDIAYDQLVAYYRDVIGIEDNKIDRSGKDITRLCYASSDERAYLNEDAIVFKVQQEKRNVKELPMQSEQIAKSLDFSGAESQFLKVVELTKNAIPFVEGNRNNFVNLLSNNSNRWGISIEEALKLIIQSEFCYDLDEVTATVKSAYKNNHQHNTFPLNGVKREVATIAEVAGVAQLKTQPYNLNKKLKSFYQHAEDGKNLAPLKKLFGNYILEKSTTLFPAERGIGKSFLAMQIAIMVAGGASEFLGEAIEITGNVLYLNLELGDHTICKRMEKLLEGQNLNKTFLPYSYNEKSSFIKSIDEIKSICNEIKPVLIIIDNLKTAFSGVDNEKNKEMTLMILEIARLKEEFDSTVLIVHHTKKGMTNQLTHSDMQSGAGSLSDLVDADFFLRRSGVEPNHRILKRIKSRECEEQEGAKLIKLNPDTLWFEFVEEGVDENVHVLFENSEKQRIINQQNAVDLIKKGIPDAEIARQLGVDKSTVGRWRKKNN